MKMIGKAVRVTMAMVAAALIAWGLCGCEDDGDEVVVHEAPAIPTNGSSIVVSGNTGSVVVEQITTGKNDPTIMILANTGKVFVTTGPEVDEEGDEP